MGRNSLIKVCILCLFYLPITKNASGQALQDVNSWLYQLQQIDIVSIAASSFDLVVIDYSSDGSGDGEFTLSQIQQLKNSGKIVLSYMSIGEAEDYRYYWQSGW
ncbi:MAG: endo alpha-1,4 polygalactosaminidase, partial [Candidatus Marinimicrobia bacterium]|nr:endo alpha-1,4 polygalactosaminidase [Candidatus Neomarinimicrobiota bacterium]